MEQYKKKCLTLSKKQKASAGERDALAKSNIEKKLKIQELMKVIESHQELLEHDPTRRQTEIEFDKLNSSRTQSASITRRNSKPFFGTKVIDSLEGFI